MRVDTRNPPGNETAAAQVLEKFLSEAGMTCEVIEPAPGRGSVLCRLAGEGGGRPALVMAHLDVVGVDEKQWKVPPFSAALREGYIHGRGVLDDKGMAAAAAEAFALVARSGRPRSRDLLFLGTADEESSGEMGIHWLLEHRPELAQVEMALNEGGRILKIESNLALVALQNDEKRYLDVKLAASGTSGHSSLPGADNPILHLARAVERLGQHRFPYQPRPETRAYFEALSRLQDAPTAHCMTHLDDPSEGPMCADILSRNPVWNALLRTTCAATVVQAGFRNNVIPSQAEANLNCRLLPGTDPRGVASDLRRALGDLPVRVDIGADWGTAPAPSPMEGPLPQAVRAALARLAPGAPLVPYTSPGTTDSRLLRERGIPAYGLLPFPLYEEEMRTMHADNERLSRESFEFGVRLMYEIVGELVYQK